MFIVRDFRVHLFHKGISVLFYGGFFMAKTNIVDWKTITDFVIDAFVGYGIPREDADICAIV